jgi:ZIP family zinc transporter
MEDQNILFAFLLTLFAGLSTGIGSLIALLSKRTNTAFLSVSLGLSAGVMIYVSFMEMLPEAIRILTDEHGERDGSWMMAAGFFGGILLIAIIDRFIPAEDNPHEIKGVEDLEKNPEHLRKVGIFTAVAIAIHNFPEGIATFTAALSSPEVAIPIAVAIAIHNIPEGIAVSVPIYYATGNRKKAFWLSFLSGMSEPVGALIGYAFLSTIMNDTVFGILFASVAGIMVFISLDELLPSAQKYGKHHYSMWGLVGGMGIMALSLLLFV